MEEKKVDTLVAEEPNNDMNSQHSDRTIQFSIIQEHDREMKQILSNIYSALEEKGYNPISQIVGYILSEDPTYITTHNNARSLIRKIDRDELLQSLVKFYINK